MLARHMQIESFHDRGTGTVTHVVADTRTGQAAVIDPVLDFEPHSGSLTCASADRVIDLLRARGWQLQWVLETHAHADHLSAAQHLRHVLGGKVAIGARIRQVQEMFRSVFRFERGFLPDGSQFDHLFEDGERFRIGELEVRALWVPGHTPADMAYLVEDAVFVGDTLFMPDVGTARADFPGGDAATLYRSIQRLLTLPDDTRVHVCHDYPPPARAAAWVSTVREQRSGNIHVRDGTTQEEFVRMRTARDASLSMPTLILPAVQVNVRGGRLPAAEGGRSYIQVPVNAFLKHGAVPQGI
ncbi:MBL fold metallo-hydrolase [Comamonas endophytica]|uniref:MBL fold metallo-hydrolase n=1 Tax=Comamonas endophytica TaxID=2949090 RepID=A0ABY6G813_9BURK|nr:MULTISPECIES: MBL fold metallo-hydrolase [unclassified Acidovorax]MCD2514052.1 MBL fold metallo-hydrolase [Acidovorax sp. D4N7]UYG51196.1 MBL fold metallo-hydrolase [Acidovorax sp. 5MLIR]